MKIGVSLEFFVLLSGQGVGISKGGEDADERNFDDLNLIIKPRMLFDPIWRWSGLPCAWFSDIIGFLTQFEIGTIHISGLYEKVAQVVANQSCGIWLMPLSDEVKLEQQSL